MKFHQNVAQFRMIRQHLAKVCNMLPTFEIQGSARRSHIICQSRKMPKSEYLPAKIGADTNEIGPQCSLVQLTFVQPVDRATQL